MDSPPAPPSPWSKTPRGSAGSTQGRILAANAVKFTEHGKVRVVVTPLADRLEIAVHDTGPGIRPEQMDRLFEAFRQVDGSARRHREGAGLGLYLCQKLTGLLHGGIHAESEFGRGSVFKVWLPVL